MQVVELFAGTASFGNAAKKKGYKVFTSDFDEQFETDYCVDIMKLDVNKLPKSVDIVWASPPCETFSVASIGYHWNKDRTPKTEAAELGIERLQKAIAIIEELKPKHWFIENPRGMMRKMPFMEKYYRYTVTYCQYGDTRMKPTDIWSNVKGLEFKACRRGMTCHIAAPRGSSTGTQGIKTYKDRSRIPEALCNSILEQLERLK